MRRLAAAALLACLLGRPDPLSARQVDFLSVLDTSLFSEASDLSDGAGPHVYTGLTNQGARRRALVAFEVGSIPVGATVTSVVLSMRVSQAAGGNQTVALHRVTTRWGEGSSNSGTPGGRGATATSGDATWTFSDFSTTSWSTPGGDFVAPASGSSTVGGVGNYTWSSPGLVADVQAWVDGSAPNFGWILIANESVAGTAKRFESRENQVAANRPKLTVTWAGGVAVVDVPSGLEPSLGRNWPNPFSTTTQLDFTIETASSVSLEVFDLLGRRVQTLLDDTRPAGNHTVTFDAAHQPAGIYIARLRVGSRVFTRQMVRLP